MSREDAFLWSFKSFFVLFILLSVSLLLSESIFAHPGNTAADGCHYCRTNCDKWGVPWNQRHCHGGSVALPPAPITEQPPQVVLPTNTPTPFPIATATSTPVPTSTPTPTILPTITNTPTPTSEAQVLGAKSDNESTGGDIAGFLVGVLTVGVIGWRAVTQKWPFHSKVNNS